MTWEIIQADARSLPLDDASVDEIITSPPYWGLRSYRDGGEHYDGQFGSEPSPREFVDGLVGMIDGEWRRVLKPSGSLWLNLGDKYNNRSVTRSSSHQGGLFPDRKDDTIGTTWADLTKQGRTRLTDPITREKSLLGLPWRVALQLIDAGWILRAAVVWNKTGMPESVTDRVRTTDQEMFFHFTTEPHYYSAIDEIREPAASPDATDRIPGSVWKINYEPPVIPDAVLANLGLGKHHASFPTQLVHRPILGWSPPGGVILDPMCGTGTVPGVAHKLGRHGIGVDLSNDYCRLARWRIESSGAFEKVTNRTWQDRQLGML